MYTVLADLHRYKHLTTIKYSFVREIEIVSIEKGTVKKLGERSCIPYHYCTSCIEETRVFTAKQRLTNEENYRRPEYVLHYTYVDKDGQPVFITDTSDTPQPYILLCGRKLLVTEILELARNRAFLMVPTISYQGLKMMMISMMLCLLF